jgi:hypothetical protein
MVLTQIGAIIYFDLKFPGGKTVLTVRDRLIWNVTGVRVSFSKLQFNWDQIPGLSLSGLGRGL